MKHGTLFASALLCALMVASPVLADSHSKIRLSGTVASIDQTAGTFVVKQLDGATATFAVDPRSDFEVENQNTGHDVDVPFTDLKVGDKVRVKAYPPVAGSKLPLVDDVDILR